MKKTIFILLAFLLLIGCPINEDKPKQSPTKNEKTKCDILIMGYFAGDNNLMNLMLEDMVDLGVSLNDLEQIPNHPDVKIVVLFDGSDNPDYNGGGIFADYGETKLYEIGAEALPDIDNSDDNFFEILKKDLDNCKNRKDLTDKATFIPKLANGKTEADTSDYRTLQSFIEFCYDNYDFDRSILDIFTHGSGVYSKSSLSKQEYESRGWAPDETSHEGYDFIGTNELGTIFLGLKEKYGKKIDCLFLESCLSAGFEELYEIRNGVDFVVASANELFTPSIDYGDWIINLKKDDDGKAFATKLFDLQTARINNIFLMGYYQIQVSDQTIDKWDHSPNCSNTFGCFDMSKCDKVYSVLNKVIDTLYESEENLKMQYRMGEKSLINHEKLNLTDYPYLVTYLVDKNTSFLSMQNGTGTVNGECTTLGYLGTFNWLHDIGYLMDMYINTDFTDKQIIKTYNQETGEKTYYSPEELEQFKNDCGEVCKALSEMIVKSYRRDCTTKEALGNLYSQLPNYNIYGNHYGVTIAGACSDYVEYYYPKSPDYNYYVWSTFGYKTKWRKIINGIFES